MSDEISKYTPQQETFLDVFIEEAMAGNSHSLAAIIAKDAAGYSKDYSVAKILAVVNDEIVKRCQHQLTMSLPKAVKELDGVLHDPEKDGARRTLEAVAMVMDRTGLTKKEHIEMEVKADSGIVLIPPKQPN